MYSTYAASLARTAAATAHAQSSVSFHRHVSVLCSVYENARSVPIPRGRSNKGRAAQRARHTAAAAAADKEDKDRTGCGSSLGVARRERGLHSVCGAVGDAHVAHAAGALRERPVRSLARAVRVRVREQQRQPLRRHGAHRAEHVRLPHRPPQRRHHRDHRAVQRPARVLRAGVRAGRTGGSRGVREGRAW